MPQHQINPFQQLIDEAAGVQPAPQIAPQIAPQLVPQAAPQLAPQTAPQTAPQRNTFQEAIDADAKEKSTFTFERGFERLGEAAMKPIRAVGAMIEGEHDPAFADVEGFDETAITDLEIRAKINKAKLLGVTDEAFGNMVIEALKKRITKPIEEDKFGNRVITFRGDDGKVRRQFINKPGLDIDDIGRGVQSSAIFLAAAGPLGKILKPLPMLLRAFVQAGGQGAASIAQDVIGGQDVDPGKLTFAAGGGAAGEFLLPILSILRDAFRRSPGMIGANGQLTKRGEQALRDAGVDPADITAEMVESLKKPDVARAVDDFEVMARAQQDEAGFRSSRGQITQRPEDLHLEQEAREGLLGQQALEQARTFDEGLRGDVVGGIGAQTERFGQEGADLITRPGQAGEKIQAGLREELEAGEASIQAAFRDVETSKVFPRGIPRARFADLSERIQENLASANNLVLTEGAQGTPEALAIMGLLDDFSKGKRTLPDVPFLKLGKPPKQNFDDVRRAINGATGDAIGKDKRAMVEIKRGFNSWVKNLAEGELVRGADPAQYAKFSVAIGLTAKVKGLMTSRGSKDVGGKMLERLRDTIDSPEGVINTLFGGFTQAPKQGVESALRRMKQILEKNQPDAWDAVRQAYWLKLSRGGNLFKEGTLKRHEIDIALGQINRNIDAAMFHQKSLLDILYSPAEIKEIVKFSTATRRAQAIIASPLGSAGAAERMRRAAKDNFTVNLIKRKAASEQLAGMSLRAAAFRQLGRKAISIFGAHGEGIAGRVAKKVFSGTLQRQRTTGGAGLGSGFGVQIEQQRE